MRRFITSFSFLLVLALPLGFPASLGAGSDPAMTPEERAMLPFFAEVFRTAGFGMRSTEEAAFIVDDADDAIACVRWPSSAAHHQLSYRGPVPAATVAIVHSHPLALRQPSVNDRAEAKRVGLPFYVVTRDSIWVAQPDGRLRELLREAGWWRHVEMPAVAGQCLSTAQFVIQAARRGRSVEWREAASHLD